MYASPLLVNYGALMLKALFEHWPQVTVDSEEKPNGASSNSQVVNTHMHTHVRTQHTHTHTHIHSHTHNTHTESNN